MYRIYPYFHKAYDKTRPTNTYVHIRNHTIETKSDARINLMNKVIFYNI